ncbi:MAG: hypothetical protein ABIU05_18780 [Nitrospirales bacterium]
MKVEAIGKAFIYRWPGGEVRLAPGEPIELPPERAAKLLKRAQGRVRRIEEPPIDWLQEWRRLAAITAGLGPDDPRLPLVLTHLDECDEAFLNGHVATFTRAAVKVEQVMQQP